jgi:CubicO group peptidase (beta-lactamase class C family)
MQKSIFTLLLFVLPFLAYPQVDIQELDDYFAKAHKDWGIPGMAVGIIKDGEVVLAKGYGVLEDGKEQQVDGNSLFAIASNTKAFISASLARLVDEGKLGWDAPVIDHLPDFRMYDDYVTQHTTVRDLLCHRAGLGTYSGDVIWYKSEYSGADVVRRVNEVPQAYDFRAGYGYSNLMFITAGEVIQAVSGKPWNEYIAEHFFTPLGMDRTVTSTNDLQEMDNVATPHKPMQGKNKPIAWTNWDNMGAAGGIISSVNDMLKWMQLQIEGGQKEGKQFFSRDRQIDFWTPHNSYRLSEGSRNTYPARNFSGYGLGWGVFDYDGRFVASHGGGYDGMYSRVAIMPEEKLGFVILTNSMKGISNPMMYHTFDRFLERPARAWSEEGLANQQRSEQRHQRRLQSIRDKRVAATRPDLALKDYTGTYRCEMYGDITVGLANGKLTLDFKPAPQLSATLEHWHFNTFEIKWKEEHAWFDFGTLQFVLDNNGQVVELRFDVPNYDIFFDEIHAQKVGE